MFYKIIKNNCRKLIPILSMFFLLSGNVKNSYAQEMYGVTFSDYNGISSTMLNPALMTGSRLYLDVNLVSGNIFFDNTMFYLPSSFNWFPKFVSGEYNFYNGEFKYGRSYNYYDNTNEKFIVGHVRTIGPSVMIQAGKHAFGLSTAFRTYQSGNGIPFEIPIIAYEEISYPKYHRIEFNDYNVNIVGMSWAELGLSYAYDLIDHLDHRFTIGASIKGLFGMEAAYASARNINYIIVDRNTMNIINLDADFGFALPLNYETNEPDFNPAIKGYGVGGDIGFLYTKKSSRINFEGERMICAKPYQDYIYKIGISLLDLGSISFNKNAELHRYENVGKYWDEFDTLKFNGLQQAVQDISTGLYGSPDSSFYSDKIQVGLTNNI